MDLVQNFKTQTQATIAQLKEDLKSFRTGRANPALLENIMIETYGGSTKLRLLEMATITNDGPTALTVAPFDPSTTQDVERGILKSPLGLSPQVNGNRILVRIPPLSEEQREKYIKLVSQKVEEKKGHVRNQRDESRKKIKNMEEAKEISEDERKRLEKDIDAASQQVMIEIQSIKDNKEKEIMEV